MVCIYCGSPTQVRNSRLQKRLNNIWRRRQCIVCAATFTTSEGPVLGGSFMVKIPDDKLEPFNRDKLFIAVYESCRHRPSAAADAAGLTETITNQILSRARDGMIRRKDIVETAHRALRRFDSTAGAIYLAYHPLTDD